MWWSNGRLLQIDYSFGETHCGKFSFSMLFFSSVMDYASQVFLNPGKGQELRLLKLCKRAFYMIHGNTSCTQCDILNIIERRRRLAMKLFNSAQSDEQHVLHYLVPSISDRSQRIILPHARTSRRVNSFFFSCSLAYNDQL